MKKAAATVVPMPVEGLDLPEGWESAPLLSVLDYQGGAQPPKETFVYEPRAGYVRLLQIRDFGDKPFPTYVRDTPKLKKVRADDLLVARYGGESQDDSLGRVVTGLAGAYNVALVKLVFPQLLLLPAYLRAYLQGPWFKATIGRNSRSCQLGFNRGDLQDATIPIAPLTEQRRIAATVEDLLARVNAADERLAKVPKILKAFRQSVLAAACSGRLTEDWRGKHPEVELATRLLARIRSSHEQHGGGHGGQAAAPTDGVHTLEDRELPDSWAIDELKWLCKPGRAITYGILKPGPDYPKGVPYIRVADFPGNQLNACGVRRTSPEIAHDYRRSILLAGDILLSIRGTAGRVCRVPKELAGANITQDTARVSVHTYMSPEFIELYLKSPGVQKRLEAAMKGVAVRGVNIGDVRALQIAAPPFGEQQEIVRRVEALLKLADVIEKRVAAATVRAGKLTQSILAKAFRGELVPTEAELARREGRAYEPASLLLERIKSERQWSTTAKGPRHKAATA